MQLSEPLRSHNTGLMKRECTVQARLIKITFDYYTCATPEIRDHDDE